ncbi:unnamed protein product [Prunus armeniaca]
MSVLHIWGRNWISLMCLLKALKVSSSVEGSSQTPTINTPLTPSETPLDDPQTVDEESPNVLLPPLLPKRQPVRKSFEVWNHFTKEPVQMGSDVGLRTSCNYRHSSYAYDPTRNGTSTLMQHWKVQCKGCSPLKEDNKQKVFSFENKGGLGFKYFMRRAQPRFDPPSRRTIARDVWSIFEEEKAKLKSILSGEAIGRLIEKCLADWGIENVFSITVDNASANDGVVKVALEDSNFEAYFNEVDKDEMPKEKKRRFGWEASSRTRATLKFSTSKMVTTNTTFHKMAKIVNELNGMMQSRDLFMKRVATSMKN